MKQRTIIITGANRGIGKGITRELAKTDSRIIMACRNTDKSMDVYKNLKVESKNDNIELLELDLASVKSIQSFVNAIKDRKLEIAVLINNAGILSDSYQETVDGFELTIGVNYIGQYLLTRLLLPNMGRGIGRIINTSSIMYRFGKVDADFFQFREKKYRRFYSYANSKLALLLFSIELAEQVKQDGITVNSVDPGIVNTDMLTMNKWFDPLTDRIFRPLIKTEEAGARTSVYLAIDQGLSNVTSKYFISQKERKIPLWVKYHQFRKKLWDETAKGFGI